MIKLSVCLILISIFIFTTAFKGSCKISSKGGDRLLVPHPTSWRLIADSTGVPWVIDDDGKIGWSGGVMCAFGNGEIFVYDRKSPKNQGPNCRWNVKENGEYYTIENQQYKGSYISINGDKETRLDATPEQFKSDC
uniref:Secreted salivary protein n=1 Tax=Culicoides nubeculosus TaxID=144565 RepID=B9URH5_CULNU|nr:secreted salivary protein [Culicoides nubeculosus]